MADQETFNFGKALDHLEDSKRVARIGWNGKEMYLLLVDGGEWEVSSDQMDERENDLETTGFILLKTAQGKLVPWVPSQDDILAGDWFVVE
jgi:hypothetical protein